MLRKLSIASLALLAWLAVAPVVHANEGNQNPLNPKILGKTYGEWAAEWWQWALAGPDGMNVVQDTTGEFCDLNQPAGNVWFLAGTFGGLAERSCTIPPNKALFYPLLNSVWVDCPPPSPDGDLTDEQVRGIMAAFGGGGNNACQLTSSIDGEDVFGIGAGSGIFSNAISSLQVPAVRTQSPKFSMLLPSNHVFSNICDPDVGPQIPPGETGRSIAEGHWVMLPPLSPGEHVLTLHGADCLFGFEVGVTYNLIVE